jgi:hypothetical protein
LEARYEKAKQAAEISDRNQATQKSSTGDKPVKKQTMKPVTGGGMGTRRTKVEFMYFHEIDNEEIKPVPGDYIQATMHKGNNDLLEGTTDTRAAADKIVVGLTPTPPEVLQNFYLQGGVDARMDEGMATGASSSNDGGNANRG